MEIPESRILLTGAAGGIGQAVARELAARGGRVALVDRNREPLEALAAELGEPAVAVAADLLDPAGREACLAEARERLGGIDCLVNLAGVLSFRPFAEEAPETLERLLQLNTVVPILLTRACLPAMLERGRGWIVNVGSTFGSIGFAYFAAYSASKGALHAFSEALRRELAETGVGVTYVAPRAVRTPLNAGAVMRMAEAVKMRMDEPEWVARRIVEALARGDGERFLGFPESLFVRINGLWPRLVDRALRKQNRVMAAFARGA
ncbi:MAG: SDR family oxidoreductase [Nitrospirae bacterium]|nr:MAG: SDR family oxidoreductase [Nitrospirota bacterium]